MRDERINRSWAFVRGVAAWYFDDETDPIRHNRNKQGIVDDLSGKVIKASNQSLVDKAGVQQVHDHTLRAAEAYCFGMLMKERGRKPRKNEYEKLWRSQMGQIPPEYEKVENRLGHR